MQATCPADGRRVLCGVVCPCTRSRRYAKHCDSQTFGRLDGGGDDVFPLVQGRCLAYQANKRGMLHDAGAKAAKNCLVPCLRWCLQVLEDAGSRHYG